MRLLARTLLLIGLIAAVPAAAQTDPPARVGRVSLISGTLAFFGPGDADWSAAKVNLPVATGAWLATDPQSRAEIRVGPESVDLAQDTQLNVLDLHDKVMQLALTQGRIDLHLRRLKKDETAEIDTPRGGVWLLEPGVYDVDTGGPDQPTRIMVFEGSARFVGDGVDTVVNAGDRLVLTGTDTLTATVERAAPDEFVRWCRSHDYHEQRLAAPYRVSPRMTGYEELDAYGEWADAPNYGAVWYPKSLPADWAPYREGRWVWIEPWGWNWVDDEPWGFAPFHYGRWARIEDRWAWAPGEFVEEPVYAPALVAFIPPTTIESAVSVPVDAGPPVGWFPLAPGEVYWPSYARDPAYIRNVNITNVSVAVLNTVIAGRSASADPPPQVVKQQFANRAAATVVPTRAMVASAPVAKAAVAVAPQVLQRAAATVQPPPGIARPSMTAASAGAPTTTAPWHGRDRAPPQPAPTASQPFAAAPAPAHPPARPNFAQLAPAPRVGHAGAASTQPASPPPGAQATRQPEIPSRSLPQAGTQVVPPVATPAHPPGPPDFAHLPPARIGPHGIPHSPQQPAAPTPGASQPSPEQANAPQPPASGTTNPPARPQVSPDFARLPPHRGAPQPPPPAQLAQPSSNEAPVAQQRANAEAAAQQRAAAQAEARQQAQQRAAAEGAARQQARQRAAAEAAARQQEAQQRAAVQQAQQRAATEAARQQSQQRGAAQAEVRQQAQQRAAAESAARQQAQQRAATEAAARQEAQRRAATESAARQQAAAQAAQQRAAAEGSARQQAQQRAAAEAAARQQAAASQQRAAAEAAARQQAAAATQQRAAAEAARQQAAAQQRTAAQAAAAQQAAQQRAAGQAAAAQQAAQQRAAGQQAQQRAAAQAAARQHQAEACGHPGQPACPH